MRIFWAIILVIFIAAGAAVFLRGGEPAAPSARDSESPATAPAERPLGVDRTIDSPRSADSELTPAPETARSGIASETPPLSKSTSPESIRGEIAQPESTQSADAASQPARQPNRSESGGPDASATDPPEPVARNPEAERTTAAATTGASDSESSVAGAAESSSERASGSAAEPSDESTPEASPAPPVEAPVASNPAPTEKADAAETLDELLGLDSASEQTSAASPVEDPDAALASEPDKSPTPAVEARDVASEVASPEAVRRRRDGAIEIGDRFIVRGKGTPADPYQVTWDLLVSANEVYRPRQGKKELPGWANTLNGAYVEITGFLTYPLMADAIEEVLVMRNQWDGCCLGIPPTPYDAIEVSLREPKETTRRGFSYGSITGRLNVDPYLVNDWLIGLYTIEDATLEVGM